MAQTSVTLNPAAAVPGLLADSGYKHVVTRINKEIAQVVTITIDNVVDSTDYVTTVNGVTCTFTSDSTATEAEINAGMLDSVNDSVWNGPDLSFDVTAAQGVTTATLTITADSAGTGFTATANTNVTAVVTTQNSGDVPFGVGVVQGSASDLAHLPTATGQTLVGITCLDQTQPNQPSTGDHEYTAGSAMGIVEQGRVWVIVEDAVVAGGSVYIRFKASANGTQLGAVRSDTDSASADQLTAAVFGTTQATPGGLAVVTLNRP